MSFGTHFLHTLVVVSMLALVSSLGGCSGCSDDQPGGGGGNEENNGNEDAGVDVDNDTDENNNANCIDEDGDGYGEGCSAGPDCNDARADARPGGTEQCDGIDNDCDGVTDPDCPCFNGAQQSCYSGAEGTRGIAHCRGGVTTCEDGEWSECLGQSAPTTETCNGDDDDCDGLTDEGLTNACGACDELPAEICGDGLDNNCDGTIDESAAGCNCDQRENQPCYSGPPQTLGRGICQGGFHTCNGVDWGACDGEVLPGTETCNGLDDDCDGVVDEGQRNSCGECGALDPEEICDGVDNDCDSIVDEGLTNACGNCLGEIPAEVCGDGIDNDCDGLVDEGCQCTGEETCYSGPPDTLGVGACRAGNRTCDGEFWTECMGDLTPSAEICDAVDNDCDGFVDEGPNNCSICGPSPEQCDGLDNDCDALVDEEVTNLCGTCEVGTPDEVCGNGVDDDCDGLFDEGLLNACGTCGDSCYIRGWEDNGMEGGTFAEGEIDGLDVGTEDDPGLRLGTSTLTLPFIWIANSDEGTISKVNTETAVEEGRYTVGSSPSRTAVDLNGDVWVGNRNSDNVHRVRLLGCVDQECVDPPIPAGDLPRGLAVDANNHVWVGLYNDSSVKRINTDTMTIDITVPTPGNVYGVAIDSEGNLWTSERGGGVVSRINTETGMLLETLTPPFGRSLYGIAVDGEGSVWLGNYSQNNVLKYTPSTGMWNAYNDTTGSTTRGLAVDGNGFVWVANSGSNNVTKFRGMDGAVVGTYPVGNHPIGVAIDSSGFIWVVNRNSDDAYKLDPNNGSVVATVDVGDGPYTYSDMTGFQLRNFTARQGTWEVVYDCGWPMCQYDRIRWDSDTPPGTTLVVTARTSEDQATWSSWSPEYDTSPADLSLPTGRYLNIVVMMTTDNDDNTPVLRSLQVDWQRP